MRLRNIIRKFASKFTPIVMDVDFLHYEPIKNPDSSHGRGIAYQSMMKRQIRKHSSFLQPMFEAISNSLESKGVSEIEVALSYEKTLHKDIHNFLSLHITDNGIGFNDVNFERFVTLFDDSKGFNNFGTGRIQFLHYFKYTQIRSVYLKEGIKRLRTIVLSNDFYHLYRTSILTSDEIVDDSVPVNTTVSFFVLNKHEDRDLFQELSIDKVKHEILIHYLSKFCLTKATMPVININKYVNEVKATDECTTLTREDIPNPDYEHRFEIHYSTISDDKKSVIPIKSKKAEFTVQSFALPYDVISKNEIKLTSKGESVDASKFDFNLIKEAPRIGETFMFFLVSSDYLTSHDQDERGKLKLYTKKELLSSNNLFSEPEVVVDDIQDVVVNVITERYPVIKDAKDKYDLDIENMAALFSLDVQELRNIGIKVGETPESLLRRYHEYNGSIRAKKEAQVKSLYDSLSELEPGHEHFERDLKRKVSTLTTLAPQLVRANLTEYIARRKLVLLIFKLAIQKQLLCQKEAKEPKKKTRKKKTNQHEKHLHNIIFSQHSTDPKDSNLWLLSDEFIHFAGVSEKRLLDVKYNGQLLLREDLTDSEREELKHFEHDDITTRPDILLFPEEHKCVIIEFKSPDVELSNQIEQINNYASIIRQFSKPEFEITNFYAYLIGEKIDYEAFKRCNPDFESSYYFDYAYCPDKKVYGGARSKGSMYIEVITFSSLFERATSRNKIFTEQLD